MPGALTIGQTYYIIQYEDEKLTIPMISSWRYKERTAKDSEDREHLFALVGFSEDELMLRERDLDIVLDLAGLVKELTTPNIAAKGIDHDF
ncbi:MAG: hypothetical protein H6R13_2731 [Proteobacteria bacterium]|nr:hypothetical protein [Pseudomonadota bacterium]